MKNNVKYVDGFVLVIPKKNLKAYQAMAKEGARMWKGLGALDYKECIADDVKAGMGGGHPRLFPEMAGAKKDEVVWFSYIGYKSRAHRDAVNKKVMKVMTEYAKDPKNKKMVMPFDEKRMAYGGFKVVVSA